MSIDIIDYYRNHMTQTQYEEATTLFDNDDRLIYYIAYSYNCYELLHGKGQLSLITNPDALFRTPEAEQQFVNELKKYIRDVIGIKREDVQYGTSNSNRTNKENPKNK